MDGLAVHLLHVEPGVTGRNALLRELDAIGGRHPGAHQGRLQLPPASARL